jgi:SAM-dependent methyltransferase
MLEGLITRASRAPGLLDVDALGTRLAQRKTAEDPTLRRYLEMYTLEQARGHFADVVLEQRYLQEVTRYFHARRVQRITERLGPELASLTFLDVGDTDGLILKHLGKKGVALNNSPKACEQIRSNGVEAREGDGQRLPFDDGAFDVVMCFETLEHVPNPGALLAELIRVARRTLFLSIPGVQATLVHPRLRGSRLGEEHIVEFSEPDFRAFLTHFPVRIVHYERMDVFGRPRGLREAISYRLHASRHLFGGCFKFFQFYELALADADQGVDRATYDLPYRRG